MKSHSLRIAQKEFCSQSVLDGSWMTGVPSCCSRTRQNLFEGLSVLKTKSILMHRFILFSGLPVVGAIAIATSIRADVPASPGEYERNLSLLLEAYRQVEVASVSDAEEQSLHEKHYTSHRMQPVFATKFAGVATTVLMKKRRTTIPMR